MSINRISDTSRVSLFDDNRPENYRTLRVVPPTNGEAIRQAAMSTPQDQPLEQGAVLTIVEPPGDGGTP